MLVHVMNIITIFFNVYHLINLVEVKQLIRKRKYKQRCLRLRS